MLAGFQKTLEGYKALAVKAVTRQAQVNYIERVLATPAQLALPKQERTPQLANKVNLVVDLLDHQKGLELVPAARGTAWQAYNAVTEYLSHHHGNEENRLSSQVFGSAAVIGEKAFQQAMVM
jgi:hypothetical protein